MADTNLKFPLRDGTLARELRKRFGVNAGYNQLWKKHADGVISLRREPGRCTGLHATDDDLPSIAAAFGYIPPKDESLTPSAW